MPIHLINPLNEAGVGEALPAPRLRALSGKTIALLDISKPGGSVFLERLEHLLKERYAVTTVLRATKPTFAKPAPRDVIDKLRGADAVIEALAD